MKYTEHEILFEKWKNEEKQRRLDERKKTQEVVEVNKS